MQMSLPARALSTALHHCSEAAPGSNAAYCNVRAGAGSSAYPSKINHRGSGWGTGKLLNGKWCSEQPSRPGACCVAVEGQVQQVKVPGRTHSRM